MISIFKREMRSYFTTSTGYIFLAVALSLSGILFGVSTLTYMSSDTGTYFQLMLFVLMIILPILTMRTFSEERRTKTEQLLLTAPISTFEMVMGKYLSCLCMFFIALMLTSVNYIPMFAAAESGPLVSATAMGPNVALIIGNTIALLLVGMCFIAIGLFISSLTENQFAAVVITIAILLGLLLVGLFNNIITWTPIRVVLEWLSIYRRYTAFTYGVFDFASLIYYFSIAGVFVFLTMRVYDSRKYR